MLAPVANAMSVMRPAKATQTFQSEPRAEYSRRALHIELKQAHPPVECFQGESGAKAKSSALGSRPAATLAAGLIALSVTTGVVQAEASMLPHMPLAAAAAGTGAPNQQMLDQIHFYQAEQGANASAKTPASASQLLQAAAVQLGKVETLIGIGQYESARLQLRQGPASAIRLELRKFEQDTWPGDPQAAKAIIGDVETLDAALKKTKPADECKQLVQQLQHDLIALVHTGPDSKIELE